MGRVRWPQTATFVKSSVANSMQPLIFDLNASDGLVYCGLVGAPLRHPERVVRPESEKSNLQLFRSNVNGSRALHFAGNRHH
jgi:hypothetical protein